MTQALIIRYKNADIKSACVVYENMLELKDIVEELSNKQDVESVELVFNEYD